MILRVALDAVIAFTRMIQNDREVKGERLRDFLTVPSALRVGADGVVMATLAPRAAMYQPFSAAPALAHLVLIHPDAESPMPRSVSSSTDGGEG